jgi:hypothetical protein
MLGLTKQRRVIGYAVNIDGSAEYVDHGSASALNIERTSPITISFWVKIPSGGGGFVLTRVTGVAGNITRGIAISVAANTVVFRLVNTNGTNNIEARANTAGIVADTWHHVSVSYDGSVSWTGVVVKVDDASKTMTNVFSNLSATTLATTTALIGARHTSTTPTGFFLGKLAGIAAHSKAVSGAENTAMYAGRRFSDLTAVGPTSDLVFYPKVALGDSTSSINDFGPNNYDGTPTALDTGDFVTVYHHELYV